MGMMRAISMDLQTPRDAIFWLDPTYKMQTIR